jgi:hypothetical protein
MISLVNDEQANEECEYIFSEIWQKISSIYIVV